jgi:hypothetical protein
MKRLPRWSQVQLVTEILSDKRALAHGIILELVTTNTAAAASLNEI